MILEYKKIINLLDNTPNEPSKFRTKIWVEINDESRWTHNENSQIKFKTSMIRSYLYDYSHVYIHVNGTKEVPNTGTAAAPNNRNKKVTFKKYAPFIKCISEINNTQVDDAHDIDVAMPTYNLIEYIRKHQEVYGNSIEMNQL